MSYEIDFSLAAKKDSGTDKRLDDIIKKLQIIEDKSKNALGFDPKQIKSIETRLNKIKKSQEQINKTAELKIKGDKKEIQLLKIKRKMIDARQKGLGEVYAAYTGIYNKLKETGKLNKKSLEQVKNLKKEQLERVKAAKILNKVEHNNLKQNKKQEALIDKIKEDVKNTNPKGYKKLNIDLKEYTNTLRKGNILTEEQVKNVKRLGKEYKTMSDESANAIKNSKALEVAGMTSRLVEDSIRQLSKEITDLDKSMYDLGVVADLPISKIEEMKYQFLEMASIVPQTATEMADATDVLARSGLQYADSVKMIQAATKLATATGEDLGDISKILSKAFVAFRLDSDSATKALDQFYSTALSTPLSMKGLQDSLKNSASAFGALIAMSSKSGQELKKYKEDLLGLNTALSGAGVEIGLKASQTGTMVRNLISRLVVADKSAKNAFNSLNLEMDGTILTFEKFSQIAQDDVYTALGLIGQNFDKIDVETWKSLFTHRQWSRTASSLSGLAVEAGKLGDSTEDARKATEEWIKSYTENYKVVEGFEKQMGSFGNQIDILTGKFDNLKSSTYETVKDMGTPLLKFLNMATDRIKELDDATHGILVPLLEVGGTISLLTASLGALATISQTLGLLSLFTGVPGIIAAVTAGVVSLIIAYQKLQKISNEDPFENLQNSIDLSNKKIEKTEDRIEALKKSINTLSQQKFNEGWEETISLIDKAKDKTKEFQTIINQLEKLETIQRGEFKSQSIPDDLTEGIKRSNKYLSTLKKERDEILKDMKIESFSDYYPGGLDDYLDGLAVKADFDKYKNILQDAESSTDEFKQALDFFDKDKGKGWFENWFDDMAQAQKGVNVEDFREKLKTNKKVTLESLENLKKYQEEVAKIEESNKKASEQFVKDFFEIGGSLQKAFSSLDETVAVDALKQASNNFKEWSSTAKEFGSGELVGYVDEVAESYKKLNDVQGKLSEGEKLNIATSSGMQKYGKYLSFYDDILAMAEDNKDENGEYLGQWGIIAAKIKDSRDQVIQLLGNQKEIVENTDTWVAKVFELDDTYKELNNELSLVGKSGIDKLNAEMDILKTQTNEVKDNIKEIIGQDFKINSDNIRNTIETYKQKMEELSKGLDTTSEGDVIFKDEGKSKEYKNYKKSYEDLVELEKKFLDGKITEKELEEEINKIRKESQSLIAEYGAKFEEIGKTQEQILNKRLDDLDIERKVTKEIYNEKLEDFKKNGEISESEQKVLDLILEKYKLQVKINEEKGKEPDTNEDLIKKYQEQINNLGKTELDIIDEKLKSMRVQSNISEKMLDETFEEMIVKGALTEDEQKQLDLMIRRLELTEKQTDEYKEQYDLINEMNESAKFFGDMFGKDFSSTIEPLTSMFDDGGSIERYGKAKDEGNVKDQIAAGSDIAMQTIDAFDNVYDGILQTEINNIDKQMTNLETRKELATSEEERAKIDKQILEQQKAKIDLQTQQQTSGMVLGGMAQGAGAGAAFGAPGAAIGAALGGIAGLFGKSQAEEQAEYQKEMLEKQAEQNRILEDQLEFQKNLDQLKSTASDYGMATAFRNFDFNKEYRSGGIDSLSGLKEYRASEQRVMKGQSSDLDTLKAEREKLILKEKQGEATLREIGRIKELADKIKDANNAIMDSWNIIKNTSEDIKDFEETISDIKKGWEGFVKIGEGEDSNWVWQARMDILNTSIQNAKDGMISIGESIPGLLENSFLSQLIKGEDSPFTPILDNLSGLMEGSSDWLLGDDDEVLEDVYIEETGAVFEGGTKEDRIESIASQYGRLKQEQEDINEQNAEFNKLLLEGGVAAEDLNLSLFKSGEEIVKMYEEGEISFEKMQEEAGSFYDYSVKLKQTGMDEYEIQEDKLDNLRAQMDENEENYKILSKILDINNEIKGSAKATADAYRGIGETDLTGLYSDLSDAEILPKTYWENTSETITTAFGDFEKSWAKSITKSSEEQIEDALSVIDRLEDKKELTDPESEELLNAQEVVDKANQQADIEQRIDDILDGRIDKYNDINKSKLENLKITKEEIGSEMEGLTGEYGYDYDKAFEVISSPDSYTDGQVANAEQIVYWGNKQKENNESINDLQNEQLMNSADLDIREQKITAGKLESLKLDKKNLIYDRQFLETSEERRESKIKEKEIDQSINDTLENRQETYDSAVESLKEKLREFDKQRKTISDIGKNEYEMQQINLKRNKEEIKYLETKKDIFLESLDLTEEQIDFVEDVSKLSEEEYENILNTFELTEGQIDIFKQIFNVKKDTAQIEHNIKETTEEYKNKAEAIGKTEMESLELSLSTAKAKKTTAANSAEIAVADYEIKKAEYDIAELTQQRKEAMAEIVANTAKLNEGELDSLKIDKQSLLFKRQELTDSVELAKNELSIKQTNKAINDLYESRFNTVQSMKESITDSLSSLRDSRVEYEKIGKSQIEQQEISLEYSKLRRKEIEKELGISSSGMTSFIDSLISKNESLLNIKANSSRLSDKEMEQLEKREGNIKEQINLANDWLSVNTDITNIIEDNNKEIENGLISAFKSSLQQDNYISSLNNLGSYFSSTISESVINSITNNKFASKMKSIQEQIITNVNTGFDMTQLQTSRNMISSLITQAESERSKIMAIKDMFSFDNEIEYKDSTRNIQYETGTSQRVVNNYYNTVNTNINDSIGFSEDAGYQIAEAIIPFVENVMKDRG